MSYIDLNRSFAAISKDHEFDENDFDLIVFDEINYCASYGWIPGEEIAAFIDKEKPAWMHLILTGRNAPDEIIAAADTVTEMKKIKHAYEADIPATQGIEF